VSTPSISPEVEKQADELIRTRTEQLTKICTDIVNKIKATVDNIPYGLRLVCKQIFNVCSEVFPKMDKEEFWKVIGYYVYFRFINLVISQPDQFEVVSADLPLNTRKNLLIVAKVLQQAFNLSEAKKEENQILKAWYQKTKPVILEILKKLITGQY
jgi:Ras GTPase-activating-like protein IQGAP2/3